MSKARVNKGGRPPKITVSQAHELIDSFISDCSKDADVIPSDYRFLEYIKDNHPVSISVGTLDNWYVDNTQNGYSEATKKLIKYREDRLLRKSEANPKVATPFIFQLKQVHSGGYRDRPKDDAGNADVKVTVKLDM